MGIVKQKGILDKDSNPVTDADVIMTAAMIGYAWDRLSNGKNCRIDLAVKDPVNAMKANINSADALEEFNDVKSHHIAIAKINKALQNGGMKSDQVVQLGISPLYDVQGNKTTITGGTGDKAITDTDRYEPQPWSTDTSKLLFDLALGKAKDAKGNIIPVKVGYQGKGAYTGFVEGRKNGQSSLMSTYRFKVPENKERRWIPSDDAFAKNPGLGAAYGKGDKQKKVWGLIVDNSTQKLIKEQGMYFQDEDAKRGFGTELTNDDLVGYVHGLPQAIYNVEFHKETSGSGGTPYEIAVGKETYKRSSCFNCSIFMEATGYPASSTHIGKGESWCILHSGGSHSAEDRTRDACNEKWASYCKKIITKGMACMVTTSKNLVKADHQPSFAALKAYLRDKDTEENKYDFANLILDAVTVSSSEYKRIIATIID